MQYYVLCCVIFTMPTHWQKPQLLANRLVPPPVLDLMTVKCWALQRLGKPTSISDVSAVMWPQWASTFQPLLLSTDPFSGSSQGTGGSPFPWYFTKPRSQRTCFFLFLPLKSAVPEESCRQEQHRSSVCRRVVVSLICFVCLWSHDC